jgi:nucleotide-binding universal stress UspA family protein
MTTARVDEYARRIVVGVDGSHSSQQALQWSAEISRATGVGIDAVFAWQLPRSLGWKVRAWPMAPDFHASTILAGIVENAFGSDRPADLRMIAEEGTAAEVLTDYSTTAALVVVGSRGHGGFAGLLLGSVSRHCVENSECPVLVIHGPDITIGEHRGRVVVGVDGSAPSILALNWATAIARRTKVDLQVTVAWTFPVSFGPVYSADWRPDRDAAEALSAVLADHFGDTRPDFVRECVVEGHAAATLIDASEDAALIVVGSRGHGGFAGLLLGSVSSACAEHAHCPVLVVRGSAVASWSALTG